MGNDSGLFKPPRGKNELGFDFNYVGSPRRHIRRTMADAINNDFPALTSNK